MEQEIKSKTEEKFKLYNFLRPSRRESIQGQIDYLNHVKRDVQKHLLAKDLAVQKTLGAAGLKYDAASKQAEQAQQADQALSRVKGHAVMARMEMFREAERLKAAIEYGEFRQVPLRDAHGFDYTKSLREVEPRSALEAVVRHFTDSRSGQRVGASENSRPIDLLRSDTAGDDFRRSKL